MNTLYLARIVLFIMIGVNLSNSSPIERLKRSTKRAVCPPGIWTCLNQKRNRMISQPEESVPQSAPLSSEMSAARCPPGIWTCATANGENETPGAGQQGGTKRASINRDQLIKGQPIVNDNDEEVELNEDGIRCPPGTWVCKRKRMLKKMMKEAKRAQRSAQKCPPGIWVC